MVKDMFLFILGDIFQWLDSESLGNMKCVESLFIWGCAHLKLVSILEQFIAFKISMLIVRLTHFIL